MAIAIAVTNIIGNVVAVPRDRAMGKRARPSTVRRGRRGVI